MSQIHAILFTLVIFKMRDVSWHGSRLGAELFNRHQPTSLCLVTQPESR